MVRKHATRWMWFPYSQRHFEQEIWRGLLAYLEERGIHEFTSVDWSFGVSDETLDQDPSAIGPEGRNALDALARVKRIVANHILRTNSPQEPSA